MNIASNIINLADHRKFVMPVEDEEVSIKELFPEHLQAGIAAIELEMEQAKQDHQRFLRMARTFKPSEIPVFINPLLAPLWNLRFDNAKLKDLFVPLRSKVTAYQYNKLYKRFGLYLFQPLGVLRCGCAERAAHPGGLSEEGTGLDRVHHGFGCRPPCRQKASPVHVAVQGRSVAANSSAGGGFPVRPTTA